MNERLPMPGGEYVSDRHGVVWRVVRDGGMVTTADDMGVISAGISWLEKTRGPTTRVAPVRAQLAARDEEADE